MLLKFLNGSKNPLKIINDTSQHSAEKTNRETWSNSNFFLFRSDSDRGSAFEPDTRRYSLVPRKFFYCIQYTFSKHAGNQKTVFSY